MEIGGFDLNKAYANAGNPSKRTDDFIDRSKVKILLCDNDTKSSEEVLTLLSECSYQVTSVSSPRQAIDVLNAEAQDIDIILAEVDLPMKKGMKMLKYIARKKYLHRIPVIMMSAHDEVSIVMKCLRLGAAEYLIKPLRSNELLNLWTHMWRRRRMLGLTEKNIMNYNSDLVASAIMNYDSDLVASDPGDGNGNTASTALFSDDTEDKSNRSTNPEIGMSIQQQHESTAAAAPEEPPGARASEYGPDVPGISDRQTRHCSSGAKKSGLRIGESSAFFSYVKTTVQKSNLEGIPQVQSNAATQLRMEDMHQPCPYGSISHRDYNSDLVASAIMNYDSDLVASDPGDGNGNTASTALFSDDTEDKSNRSTNPEIGMSIQQQHESTAAAAPEEPPGARASEYGPDVPGISDRQTRHCSSGAKKSGLRIGESSAFFSYVKTTVQKSNLQGIPQVQSNAATQLRMEDMHQTCPYGVHILKTHKNGEPSERPKKDDLPSSISNSDSFSTDNSSAPPASMGILNQKNFNQEHLPQDVNHLRNGTLISETQLPGTPSHHPHLYYISGFFNHLLMSSSAPLYPKNHQDPQNHASATMIARYNDISYRPPDANGMTSFPYHPMTVCLQPGQMSSAHSRPSFGSSSLSKAKLNVVDRRAEALMKFRKKRKERCFDKKIRYVNRKQLAERRPRVRGQFVKKLNEVNVHLNGQPASIEYDEEEEEEDDDEENNVRDSSPEDA